VQLHVAKQAAAPTFAQTKMVVTDRAVRDGAKDV
jgi:hypothetical protein